MGNKGHSGGESMPSLGDASPQTWGAFESVPRHAISTNQGSETAAGSQPPRQQRKRKVGETSDEADPRANKKVQDRAYRERVKETQMKMKKERDDLAAEKEQLQRENVQLKSDLERVTTEKKQSELQAENRVLRLEKQVSEAIAEKKLSDYKNESLQRELGNSNQRLQDLSEQLQLLKEIIANQIAQGSRISTSRCKPRQSCTRCRLQSGKTLRSPNNRIFDRHLANTDATKWLRIPASFISSLLAGFSNSMDLCRKLRIGDVNRRLTVPIQTLGTRRSHFEPPRNRGDLNILVKDLADCVWKFRCSTSVTRELLIVEERAAAAFVWNQSIQSNDQFVFYEVDLTSGANYRSEAAVTGLITIIGLDLALSSPRSSYQDRN